MHILWPGGVKYDNVLLLLSDAAPYMIKAGEGLSVSYPKTIHVTCVAHALHRVAYMKQFMCFIQMWIN